MGRLVKIGLPYHTLTVCLVRCHTSTVSRQALRLVTIFYIHFEGLQGEPYFLSTVRLFSDS